MLKQAKHFFQFSNIQLSKLNLIYRWTIKININTMTEKYAQLIKQLYERRFMDKQSPSNSYDRIRLIQRKMKENLPKKYSKLDFSLKVRDQSPFLEDSNQQNHTRIIRQTISKSRRNLMKKLSFNEAWSRRQNMEQWGSTKTTPRDTTIILLNKKSFSQRENPSLSSVSCPTGLYHAKKYEIQIRCKDRIKRQAPSTSQGSRKPNLSLPKRSTTPSKNVLIGGCNLQEEAEIYQKQFREFDKQVERYNKQRMLKQTQISQTIANRIKANRNEKQCHFSLRKQTMVVKQSKQMRKKLQSSRLREKDDHIQLMPWTVLVPEYQYY